MWVSLTPHQTTIDAIARFPLSRSLRKTVFSDARPRTKNKKKGGKLSFDYSHGVGPLISFTPCSYSDCPCWISSFWTHAGKNTIVVIEL